ncbi:MAG: hypothetical protein FWE80_03850 [Oscillospiraceae bacterium]|nr:hypothetical protein [Oscillospiraceae bacterium]
MPEKIKQKIEDVISSTLRGDVLKNALDFISWLKENKMNPSWISINSWKIRYKNKGIGNIRIYSESVNHKLPIDSWNLASVDLDHNAADDIFDNKFKEIIWSNVRHCVGCGKCAPGKDKVIFGKEFSGVCCIWLSIVNPDMKTLACVKMLIEHRKAAISNQTA